MTWRIAIADRLRGLAELDLRSLAAMRIALAVILLADLGNRAVDLRAMYSDEGFAPVAMVRSLQRAPMWSLHLLSGDAAYQAALFGLAAAMGAALLAGYRTRLATIASWILLTSLQVRMPLVTNAGDTLLRMLLFWGMFLPWGAVWSLDARRRGTPPSTRFASAATVALIVQLSIVYWVAGLAKWNDAWLHGNALGDIFSFGMYGMPLASMLSEYPALTRSSGQAVVWLELLGPLTLLVPWQQARIRTLAVATFMALHIGIAATVTVGLFSYVAMAAWLAILPSEFWNRFTWSRGPRANHGATARRMAPPPRTGRSLAGTLFCSAALLAVIYWNVSKELEPRPSGGVDRWIRRGAHVLMLRQSWGVFGRPPRQDSWFVYQARLNNGEQIDLLTGDGQLLDQKPALASRQFSNHRWRKLHWRLRSDAGEPYRQPLAQYACRAWNATHDDDHQVVRLDLYYYRQPFDIDGKGGDHLRQTLAQVVLAGEGGNFAEALRGLDDF